MSIKELENLIKYHSNKYYNEEPEISDLEFDKVKRELEEKDPDNKILKEIGSQIKNSLWKKVKLPIEAGSLNNVMNVEELKKWCDKINYHGPFVVSAKLDGGSIVERYENGECKLVATRGNGIEGEDITSQFLTSKSYYNGSIRGEVVISKENFKKKYLDKGYKNARNTASSIIRSKDADLSGVERIYYYIEGDFKEEISMWIHIVNNIFEAAWYTFCRDIEAIIDIYNTFIESEREKFKYEIDGLVITVNDKEVQKRLGIKDGRPKYSVALKFPSKKVKTKIESITWELGNSGRLTPLAHVTPVSDGYATISTVNLHNNDYIVEKDICVGDIVEIGRSGDVIPKLYRVLEKRNKNLPILPISCSSCNITLKRDGAYLVCPNKDCPGKVLGRIYKWINNLDIKYAGEEMIRALVENETIKTVVDIYKLTKEDVEKIPRMSSKHFLRMKRHIRIELTWPEILGSLSIKHFGKREAKNFCKEYKIETFEDLFKAVRLEDKEKRIGPTKSPIIVDGLIENQCLILELLKIISIKKEVQMEGKLKNQSFLFTGAATDGEGNKVKRSELEEMVKEEGGMIASSVSKTLDYLVAEDVTSNSGKAKRARNLEVKIISTKGFLEIISGNYKN